MNRRPPIDREDHIELFKRMATGVASERILLIRAESGVGKTRLLEALNANCPREVSRAIVDFKNGNVAGLHDLLNRLCLQLDHHKFSSLAVCVARFLGLPTVQIDHNTMLGSGKIEAAITVNAADEDARKARRVELTNAFLDDLSRLSLRVVLIFDTYNHCNDVALQDWLCGAFLSRASRIHQVTVVIGGQQVPAPTLEWLSLCHELNLGPIAPVFWQQYAQQIDVDISLETANHICGTLKGNSHNIAGYLDSLSPQNRQGS